MRTGNRSRNLGLQNKTWQRVQKYSKNKCFQEVCLASKCKSADLDTISKAQKLFSGTYNFHNLRITKQQSGGLEVFSMGGTNFSEPAIPRIKSVTQITHPELWCDDTEETQMNTSFNTAPRSRKKTHVCLQESDKNLVHLLDNEITYEIWKMIWETKFYKRRKQRKHFLTKRIMHRFF